MTETPSTSPFSDAESATPRGIVKNSKGQFTSTQRVPMQADAQANMEKHLAAQAAAAATSEPLDEVSMLLPNGKRRVPLGTAEPKLYAEPIPGFHQRWFNDKPNRIKRAERAGYVMVHEDGAPKTTLSGTHEGGKEQTMYLMKIPQEWADADFAYKQESLDVQDSAIYGGSFNQEPGDNRYVPKSGMNFRTVRGPGRG